MTDYMSKPFDPVMLVRTIEFYLNRNDQAGAFKQIAQAFRETAAQDGFKPLVAETTTGLREFPDQESDVPAAVVDFDSLLKRCLGNRDLPKKLLAKFHARLPDEIDQMAAAVAAGDGPLIASLAHRLKGAAANLSAEPLREAASELESIGRGGELKNAEIWLAELKTQGARFQPTSCTRRRKKLRNGRKPNQRPKCPLEKSNACPDRRR